MPSEIPPEQNTKFKIIMLKKIIFLLLSVSFAATLALQAEPTPPPQRQSSKQIKKEAVPKIAPAAPLPAGWSLVGGVWMHSDGYKFVNGRVTRTGAQTHKTPPKPPTQAQVDAVTKKKKAPASEAEIAAAKAAERERNLRPRPASQTGSHL